MNCTEIDLNKIIATQEQPLRRLLGDGIYFELELCPAGAPLFADAGMVGQILTSLIEFARRALPHGGNLLLRTEHIQVDEIHARIQPGARCGEFVRLTITDNGPGLTAEQLQNLFQLGAVAVPPSGNSLPLAIVAGIVKRRHGWMEASSHPGGGATLGIYFPAASPLTATQAEASWVQETILLVDDEIAIRRMVKTVLQRASYDVIEADTGSQALAIWEQHKDRVKLLLTDMVMPDGLTGRKLAQQLLKGKPGLRVIYTSGFDLEADAEGDTLQGAIRFLHKPYDTRRLLETIHEVMQCPQTPASKRQDLSPHAV